MRTLFRILSIYWTAKAAARGPGALGKRMIRKRAYRSVGRLLR